MPGLPFWLCVRFSFSVWLGGLPRSVGQGQRAGPADGSVVLAHVAHPAQFLVSGIAERFQIFVYACDLGYGMLVPLLW